MCSSDLEPGVVVERGVRKIDRDAADSVDEPRERDEVDLHVAIDRDAKALLHGLDQSRRTAACSTRNAVHSDIACHATVASGTFGQLDQPRRAALSSGTIQSA